MKAKQVFRLALGGAALLLVFSALIGWAGVSNASLTYSQMTQIAGGCDECNEWKGCDYCRSSRTKCSGGGSYIACLERGSDPSNECGNCATYDDHCGHEMSCMDSECTDCESTTTTCMFCRRLEDTPEYETCPESQ
jgi:hypothetical protein